VQEGDNRKTCATAENFAETWQRCRNELQKWIAEMDCRNCAVFGTDRLCRKNGSDADEFAEEMQRKV
jgi:hypothetical protein